MPKNILTRENIIDQYRTAFSISRPPVSALSQGLVPLLQGSRTQPTFAVSFTEDARVGKKTSTVFTPMWHQKDTAERIAALLPHGINTVILGDPLGAGKTYEAILTYLELCKSNPDLGLVITVPEAVILDWKEAMETVGIGAYSCKVVRSPSDVRKLNVAHLPRVLVVKQELSVATHPFVLEKLKAVYMLPRLHIFDENASVSPTISQLYDAAAQNLRLILSGTIVTNSMADLSQHFKKCTYISEDMMEHAISECSRFLSFFYTTSFAGTEDALIGATFLCFLNLSTFLHPTLYSRFASSLPIALPPSTEHFLSVDETTSEESTVLRQTSPIPVFTKGGAKVSLTEEDECAFKEVVRDEIITEKKKEKLHEIGQAYREGFQDLLIITASEARSKMIHENLKSCFGDRYQYILVSHAKREEQITQARQQGRSIIFFTQHRHVEGFNIQHHLSKIIFFDPAREAGTYIQAIGRGVRRGNQSARVDIQSYCTRKTVDYVKNRVTTTRSAKMMIECVYADPAAVFLLVSNEVLAQRAVRKGIDEDKIINMIHQSLGHLQTLLASIMDQPSSLLTMINDMIGVLSVARIDTFDLTAWRTESASPNAFKNKKLVQLFLLEESLAQFGFDTPSRDCLADIQRIMQAFKIHFQFFLSRPDPILLLPIYFQLAQGLHLTQDYLRATVALLDTPLSLTDEQERSLLEACYGMLPKLWAERDMILARLLPQLKRSVFFERLTLNAYYNKPFLFQACLDAALSDEVYIQLFSGFFKGDFSVVMLYSVVFQILTYRPALVPLLQRALLEAAQHKPVLYANDDITILTEELRMLDGWKKAALTALSRLDDADRVKQAISKSWVSPVSVPVKRPVPVESVQTFGAPDPIAGLAAGASVMCAETPPTPPKSPLMVNSLFKDPEPPSMAYPDLSSLQELPYDVFGPLPDDILNMLDADPMFSFQLGKSS